MSNQLVIAEGTGTVVSTVRESDKWKVTVRYPPNTLKIYVVDEAYTHGCTVVRPGDSIGSNHLPSSEGGEGDTLASVAVTGTTQKTITITMVSGVQKTATWTDLNDGGDIEDTNDYVNGGGYSGGVLTLTRTGTLPDIVIPIENPAPAAYSFVVGAVGAPAHGASSFIPLDNNGDPVFAGMQVDVYREGERQFLSTVRGIQHNTTTGQINFYPDLHTGEDVVINERVNVSIGGFDGGGGGGGSYVAGPGISIADGVISNTRSNVSQLTNDSGFVTSIAHNHIIADGAGLQQFAVGVGEALRFAGAGGAIVAFDEATRTVTITAGGGGAYTNEEAQDAVGSILSSEFTYNDAAPSITVNQIGVAKITGLATVATSGNYNDLINKPSIPGITTASNGLTKTGDDIRLGGTLSAHTTIALGANTLTLAKGALSSLVFSGATDSPTLIQTLDDGASTHSVYGSAGYQKVEGYQAGAILSSHSYQQELITSTTLNKQYFGTAFGSTNLAELSLFSYNDATSLLRMFVGPNTNGSLGVFLHTNDLTIRTNSKPLYINDLVSGTQTHVLGYNTTTKQVTVQAAGAATTYTDEEAQDAVGTILSAEFSYNDAAPSISINAVAQSKITGLVDALAGKAAAIHTHAQSDITNLTTDLAAKLTANGAITGATKTKITYDAKGLVTAGADLSAGDIPDLSATYITPAAAAAAYQPLDGDLAAIAALSTTGVVKRTSTNTWSAGALVAGDIPDLSATYAAASHTHAAGDIISGVIATARLGTGTADATTVLYGDGTWKPEPTGGSGGGGLSAVEDEAATSYTFVLADADKRKRFTSNTAVTATIPPNSSVAFAVAKRIEIKQQGTGQITIAAGAGVTLLSADNAYKTRTQYSTLFLTKEATDTWSIDGDAVVL